MRRAFESELIKLRRRSMILGVIGPLVAFALVATIFAFSLADRAGRLQALFPNEVFLTKQALSSSNGLARMLGANATFGGMLVAAVFASSFASEYGWGTLRNLLVRHPRRISLLLGKFVALVDFMFIARAFEIVASAAAAFALAPSYDVSTAAWLTPEGLSSAAGATLNIMLSSLGWAALGTLVAIVVRVPSIAVGIILAYALPVENLLISYWEDSGRWLPGQLIKAVAIGGSAQSPYQRSLVLILVYSLAALAASLWLFRKRDVTA